MGTKRKLKKTRGLPKGYSYTDSQLLCDLCGESFKTLQGLRGHHQFKHSNALADGGSARRPGAASPGQGAASSKYLEEEVKVAELEQKLAGLRAQGSGRERAQDLSESAGLGGLEADVRRELQARAFGVPPQAAQGGGWLELLNSPNLPLLISALKGVLGTGDNSGGLGILRELGVDLKSLWERSQSSVAGPDLKVGGISLSGVQLTPEVWKSIIAYKQAEDSLVYQKQKDQEMQEGWQSLVKLLTQSRILDRVADAMPGPGPGPGGIARSPGQQEPQRLGVECTVCGKLNELPADVEAGQVIQCAGTYLNGEPCQESWIADPDPGQGRQHKPKVAKAHVPEPPESINCECGQLLSVSGMALGSEITCPICGQSLTVMSSDIPMTPEPVQKDDYRPQHG